MIWTNDQNRKRSRYCEAPQSTMVTQADLAMLQDLRSKINELKTKHSELREIILEGLRSHGRIEPGELSAHIEERECHTLTKQKVAAVHGDHFAQLLQDSVEPTIARYLIIEEANGQRPRLSDPLE